MSHFFRRIGKYLSQTFNLDRLLESGDAAQAMRLIPFFYYVMAFIAFMNLEGLGYLIQNPRGPFTPRWPLGWAVNVDYGVAVSGVIIAFVLTSLSGAVFYRSRIARGLAFLGMLEFHALQSSFGFPNHQWDVWLWVALIFVFFPNIGKGAVTSETKKKFLLVFWAAQSFILLTYTLSGAGKIYEGIAQALAGQANSFSLDAAALQASTVLYSTQQATPLGPLIISYPILGWIPYVTVIYLELFSLLVAFKPALHRPWAVSLILFHLATYLAMRAIFVGPVPLLLILLLSSPFPGESWRKTISELPLIGGLIGAVIPKRVT